MNFRKSEGSAPLMNVLLHVRDDFWECFEVALHEFESFRREVELVVNDFATHLLDRNRRIGSLLRFESSEC